MDGNIDVERLLGKLDFSVETLAADLQAQPRLFLKACEYRLAVMREYSHTQAALAMEKADSAASCRARAERRRVKLTVSAVTDHVNLDPNVREAARTVDDCKERNEYARYVVDAFKQRGQMLRSLVLLHGADASL